MVSIGFEWFWSAITQNVTRKMVSVAKM
jgi:hypothetical protein